MAHDLFIDPAIPVVKPAHLAAVIVRQDMHFAQDLGGALYVFEKGVYRPGAETVRKWVVKILEANGRAHQWSSRLADECVEFLRVKHARPLLERPPAGTLNLENGLLDTTTLDLGPHDPDNLSATQLPVRYDKDARVPGWEKFIAAVLHEDTIKAKLPW